MTNSVLNWLQSPKNVGQMRDADGTGKSKGGSTCKDVSKLFIKVENGKIVETKFQTYGGVMSIVATSVVSEIIKGKSLKAALAVSIDDVYAELGMTKQEQKACVENAVGLIANAVNNYYKKIEKSGEPVKKETKDVSKSATVAAVKPAEVAEPKPVSKVETKTEPKPELSAVPEEKKEVKKSEPTVTVLTTGEESGEVEVDIFSEIDAITAKISEAVNKMKKN